MTREMIYKLKGANVEVEFTEKEMDGRAMWDIRFDPSLIESEYVTDEFIDFLSEVISELKRIREWMIETNTKDKDDVVDFVNKVIEEYNQQTNN